jgi:hypothetical protein
VPKRGTGRISGARSVPFAKAAGGYGTHNLEREQLGQSGVLACEKLLCEVE